MKNIYLLIGIPGAGKTHWLQDKNLSQNCVLDDMSQLDNPLKLLDEAIRNPQIKNIYIADVNFLELSVLKKAESIIKNDMGNQQYNMNYIVFKSNKQISEHNVILRNDGRKVSGTIQRFYKKYEEIINFLCDKNIEIIETQCYKKISKKPK